MENFIVSARKYRPVTFNTVVGQLSITGTLKNAIRNNQLAQAFLFCGPRGVGKTTCARILAKTINCQNPTSDTEPCNECVSCKAFNEVASFNIQELDAASNNGVEEIRKLVEQVRIPPQMGKYKVYIIDEVHMLTSAAFNAFLKTLEEPPAYAKFILATTEKHKIIPTILSRCQIFDFKRITVEDIAKHLMYVAQSEGVTADPEAMHIIAHKADGALRDALSVFDQMVNLGDKNITRELVLENLNVLDYEYYFTIMDHMNAGNYKDTLLIVNDIIEKGFDGQHFITGLGEHLRNLLMSTNADTVKLIETSDSVRAKYINQSKSITTQMLVDALEIINKCDITYRNSNNKRLALELPLVQICQLSGRIAVREISAPSVPVAVAPPAPVAQAEPSPEKVPTAIDNSVNIPVSAEKTPELNAVVTAKLEIQSVPAPEPKPIAVPIDDKKEEHELPVQSHHASSFSIKSVTKADQLANSVKSAPVQVRSELFTPEQVETAVIAYAEAHKAESALLFSALTTYKPLLQDTNVLLLTVENTVLQKELSDSRNALLDFVRNEIKNDSVTMQIQVSEKPSEDKKYLSDQDKLNQMASQYPNVGKLKDQLNLELDL
jgi:DNA polymerase-3 subunit gamma/tau